MKRILLIDDIREPHWIIDPDTDWISGPYHPKYSDETVEVARNGDAGIKKLQEQKWDVVLLDHDMGTGPDGMDVLDFMIEHPEHMPKRIYLVTANIVEGPKMMIKLKKLKAEGKIEEYHWLR